MSMMTSPIILSSVLTVPPNSKIEAVTPDLANQSKTPMWVDEIRIHSETPTIEGQPLLTLFQLRFRFALGRHPLTSDFIPAPLLGKVLNETQDRQAGPLDTDTGYVSWRLPRPLYVPPGGFLVPTCFNSLDPYVNRTANVRVSYVGRSIESAMIEPKRIDIPWVAMFLGETRVGGPDAIFVEESRESDLYNPFDVPLRVQRFIGRIPWIADLNQMSERVPIMTSGLHSLVRMTTSEGHHAIKEPTPFGHVFNVTDRSWNAASILKPKGFYLATIDEDFTAAVFENYAFQTLISMIGSREEAI